MENVDYDIEGNLIPGDITSVPFLDYPCNDHYESKSEETIYISTYECTLEDNSCVLGEVYNHIQNVNTI